MQVDLDQRSSSQSGAQRLAAGLPELLLAAEHLARTVTSGAHGRRQAGQGPDFWQYRAAQPGDALRSIDWRRSARSDQTYVAEREWALAQSLQLWRSPAQSMRYRSDDQIDTKLRRAEILGLAVGILALKGGERVGAVGHHAQPSAQARQAARIARHWEGDEHLEEFIPPPMPDHRTRLAVYLSDGLEPLEHWIALFEAAAARRMRGTLVVIQDPAERAFPFRGRVKFQSITGQIQHDTQAAEGLYAAYQQRNADRLNALGAAAKRAHWQILHHCADQSAGFALAEIWRALSQARFRG